MTDTTPATAGAGRANVHAGAWNPQTLDTNLYTTKAKRWILNSKPKAQNTKTKP